MSNIDLNELVCFIAVVRTGSFTAAARLSGVPANTLSRRVQHLESTLGVKLIQRSTRHLAITEAGHLLFERCENAASIIEQASQEVADLTRSVSGCIRVAATVDFFDIFKPVWLAQFLAVHKNVRLEFVLDDAPVNLIAERIDVAIRRGHLASSGLVARRLGTTHHILVAAPSYLRERGTPLQIGELATHDCITILNSESRNRWLLTGPHGLEEVEVHGRMSANTSQALKHAAVAGLGLALLPLILAAEELASGRLVQVFPEYRRDGGGVYAVFPGRGHVPAAATLFANFVAEKLTLFLQLQPAQHLCLPLFRTFSDQTRNLADPADMGGAVCEER